MIWVLVFICWTCFSPQVLTQSSSDPGDGKGPPYILHAHAGADMILNCDVAGNGKTFDLIEWRRNGSKSSIFIKFMNFKPHIDKRYSRRLHMVNRSAILISSVKMSDAGMYRCKTMQSTYPNTVFGQGTPVVLKVKGDASSVPSRRKTVIERYPAVLDCLTEGSLPDSGSVAFSWSKDGLEVEDDQRQTVLQSGALFVRSSRKSDSGVYTCTAKTFDSSGLVTFPGAKILLDVQFPPTIISISDVVSAPEATDARLPCVSKGNPATLHTNWTLDGRNVLEFPRFIVLQKGTLLIRNVKRSDVGSYKCIPINSVGAGEPKATRLVVKILPTFTLVPPAILTVRIGDTIRLKCAASSEMAPNVYWEREGEPFPTERTETSGGELAIRDVKKGDHGVYKCIASTANGKATHATTVAVMSTPGRPTITSVNIEVRQKYRAKRSTTVSAIISWRPGYDGGFPQKFEVWHRALSQDDYKWRKSKLLSADITSYRVENLVEGEAYMFSVRGINKEGVGPFSLRKKAGPGVPSDSSFLPDEKGKPLAPVDVTANVTTSGYYISWRYDGVPGRPSVETFKVQYRKVNVSGNWITTASALPANQRVYLFKAEAVDEGTDYDFRVFAFSGNLYSNAAYVTKRFMIAAPLLGKRSGDEALPIIAGVIGSITLLILVGLACFCYVQWGSKKRQAEKGGKKVHFALPDGTTEQYGDQEFDDEFCDPEIKLHPESVRFIPDDSEESEDEKLHRRQKMRPEDLITLTSHDSTPYGGQMLKYQLVVSEAPGNEPNEDLPAEQPLTEKVVFFGNYEAPDEYSAWYDCSLGRPAAREVRDSYDQFCHSPRDVGSRDSIDVLPHRKRALYEQQESKMMLVQKFDSNTSLVEKRNGSTASFRGSKFKAIAEEETSSEDVLRSGNLKRTRKLPSHHWSTPAVFTAQDGNNSNKDSDSDSVDSFRRGRKSRRMRPHSMYNNNKSVASSQQDDLRPKLQCICEHDAAEEEPQSEIAPTRTHKVKRVESVSSDRDSSYLHLEKRNSFLEQLQSWETDSDTGNKGCSPYDSHAKRNESESDSDRSISPAHSLVSLSDSESDRELAKKFHSSENKVEKRLSFVGEPDQTHLFRSVSYLKGVDSESASDGNSSDGQEKIDSKASSSSTNRVKTLPAVAEIQDVGRTDSLDQLKACDPFFRPPNQVSRAPSDASSGISSLQVSSSETNSIDSYSPCESRRSTRFSGGSSYSSGYGSSRSSYESQGTSYMKARDRLSKEANPPKSVKSSFPKLVEPYEWDASGLEDCDTEGTSYNAKRFDELMALQKQLGVELDSGSSNEDMRNSADLEKLSASALLKMQPKISPPRYKVDMLSDDEKDKRCSKLLAEYKTNKKVPSRKSPQTTVYRTWHL